MTVGGKRRAARLIWFGLALALAAAAIAGLRPAAAAAAGEGIEITAEVGLGGIVKEGKWTRLSITAVNETDRALKGELVFSVVQPNGGYNQSFSVPAELPQGSPVVLELTVPGTSYNENNNKLAFREERSGDEIPLTGKSFLVGSSTANTVVGVVSRDPDTLNFLPILNQRGYSLQVVPIEDQKLANNAMQLGSFDFLVLNDTATGGWSEDRIAAVRTWVQMGGTLVVSGGAGYAKTAEAFKDIVPVAADGTAALSSADSIVQGGDGKALDLAGPVTVSTGTLQAGATSLLNEGEIIVAAERKYGKGRIVYAAFDPSLEPFASWSGNSALWARMLSGSLTSYLHQNVNGFGYSNGYWEVDNALNAFPSLRSPQFNLLLVFFLIYIVIVAPGVFLTLKAADRREWAWWIIPALSVVSSLVIYSIGSADKNQTMTHSLRTMELAGDGRALRSADVAVFAPRGGTVEAGFEADVTVLPNSDESGTGNISTNRMNQTARTEPDRVTAVWNRVEYSSVRKARLEYNEESSGHGQFDIAAEELGANRKIRVTNNTEADLKKAALLANGRVYSLGDLAKGEAAEATVPTYLPSYGVFYDYGYQMFPFTGGRDEYSRHRGMLNAYLQEQGSFRPVIVGFSEDSESWFEVNGKEVKSDNLTLWVQPFEPDIPGTGAATIPPGSILPVMTSQSLGEFSYGSDGMVGLTDGSIEFEYLVPGAAETEFEELTVHFSDMGQGGQMVLSVWNDVTQQWDEIDRTSNLVRLPESADTYMTAANAVRMKLEVTGSVHIALPEIGLKGKVNS
ncbi:DUF4350 domain-containing protein [Cohnella massiliensis]|uniref:DUF4350 domain-containing protein n=1 Tax=Cohnella massiliensis TaxID=1816691 RepID=UPI0009BA00AE|nr:hypothetical protein [Cohnella massiliensis]